VRAAELRGVPFVDLITPHTELENEILDAIKGILRSGGFAGGPEVETFEQEFAGYLCASLQMRVLVRNDDAAIGKAAVLRGTPTHAA
jgi:dTDP-4-amino-4,6-dideoxygalactose transaminase